MKYGTHTSRRRSKGFPPLISKYPTSSHWRPSRKNFHRFADNKDSDEWGVKPNPGLEVTLTREERSAYARWRNERDVVRERKPAPKKEEKRKDKEKDKEKDKK